MSVIEKFEELRRVEAYRPYLAKLFPNAKSFASYHLIAHRGGPTPQEVLTPILNDLHEARRKNKREDFLPLCEIGEAILQEFEAHDSLTHNNPEWIQSLCRAQYYDAVGEPEKALAHEMEGLRIAQESDDNSPNILIYRGCSTSNVSNILRELGRFEEALPFARQAVEYWPESVVSLVNLGLSLARAGQQEEAEEVFGDFLGRADPSKLEDPLTVAFLYDDEINLVNKEFEVPSLRALVELFHSVQPDSN